MQTITIWAGTMRDEAAEKLVELAKKHDEPHRARFNDVWLVANPGDTVEQVLAAYKTEEQAFFEKYAGKTYREIWESEYAT